MLSVYKGMDTELLKYLAQLWDDNIILKGYVVDYEDHYELVAELNLRGVYEW